MHPIRVFEIAWDNYHFAGASNNLYAALFFRYTSLCGTSSTPLPTDAFYNIMDLVEAAAMGIFCKVCWYRVQINGPEVQGKKGNRRTKGKLAVVKVIDGICEVYYTHIRLEWWSTYMSEHDVMWGGGRRRRGKFSAWFYFGIHLGSYWSTQQECGPPLLTLLGLGFASNCEYGGESARYFMQLWAREM